MTHRIPRPHEAASAPRPSSALFAVDERGFSMLELLVASFMAILVVGGMLLILSGLGDVHRDQQQLIDAQQTARLAIEQVGRDIERAGIGLTGMLAPLPVIVPTNDGVIVRYNLGNVKESLSKNMGSPTAHFDVADVSGFEVGQVVAIYDGTGSFDLVTLTAVEGDKLQLHHSGGVSKSYEVADGATVKRVQTISYQLQAVNQNFALQRQEDDAAQQPVALNVRSMTIIYYNNALPPQVFTPVTLADQMRITGIEIEIEVETEDVRLNTTEKQTVTLSTRVSPRAVLLSS